MIEIPVHDAKGKQVDSLQVDEQLLGGEVREQLLKQAYVRVHANKRQGSAANRSRAMVAGSTRKLYRQKGTGNARRGNKKTQILRGGGVTFHKRPRTYRQDMPKKMRRLANRNAILAKAVDGEIKLIDSLSFDKPSTKQFAAILDALKIDRTCLLALDNTSGHDAKSAKNLNTVRLTQIDRLNAFDVLNHRYLLAEKSAFEAFLGRTAERAAGKKETADA